MSIREARISDREELVELLCEIEATKPAGRAPSETRARLESALPLAVESSATVLLVSVSGAGAIQGYCSFHLAPFLFLAGSEAYLTELFVRPSSRGLGIGTQLLEEAQRRAEERGCSRLSLLNDRKIESYQRGFYEKHGWEEREDMANFIFRLATAAK